MENKRILCIDDESMVHTIIKGVADRAGYQTECVATADEAIEIFRDFEPFLCLVDLQLDGTLNGAKLADKLHRINPLCVFVAVSGHIDIFRVGFLLGSVFTDVLQKPIGNAMIREVMDYAYKKRQRWEELT